MARQTKAHTRQGYTAADKRAIRQHIDALLELGCIACAQLGLKRYAKLRPSPAARARDDRRSADGIRLRGLRLPATRNRPSGACETACWVM